jgi:two-component system nitrate/nitrite sensor histidine kinase NarX
MAECMDRSLAIGRRGARMPERKQTGRVDGSTAVTGAVSSKRQGKLFLLSVARLPGKLGAKINGILLVFFLVALTLIALTLYMGRQLEGGAAAINEAGAERMRTYRLAYLLEKSASDDERRAELLEEARTVQQSFESTLSLLEKGDPERPLFLPRETAVREQMQRLRQQWQSQLQPLVRELLTVRDQAERAGLLRRLDEKVREFVPMINTMVLQIEMSNARTTNMMWLFQNALAGFALLGTLFLIYLFQILVILPLEDLKEGMNRMAAADFAVRLPVETEDEFGDLAAGFNRMADHLHGLYDTLEQRVADKTGDIEEKNRELAVLYEIAAYLAEPAGIESVCQGVLDKLRLLLSADAGVVRLIDAKTQDLEIVAAANLSERFLQAEARLPVGVCLCGAAAASGESVADKPSDQSGLLLNCAHENLTSLVAIPIKSKSQVFGIYNLFFRDQRRFAANEVQLLEAVGQQLGVAIENRRLVLREKEMAVSEERNLLAQELHDSIAQSLAFLNIQAQMLQGSLRAGALEAANEELARIREGIQESYDNVRELLVHFRVRVGSADLEGGIRSALEKFEGQTGIRTSFDVSGDAPIPATVSAIQVLHIVQEALSNARKHAGARAVSIAMRRGEELVIAVQDDGRGFDPAALDQGGGAHVGIAIMRERAHRIGARLEIASAPTQGTCVTLFIPTTAGTVAAENRYE